MMQSMLYAGQDEVQASKSIGIYQSYRESCESIKHGLLSILRDILFVLGLQWINVVLELSLTLTKMLLLLHFASRSFLITLTPRPSFRGKQSCPYLWPSALYSVFTFAMSQTVRDLLVARDVAFASIPDRPEPARPRVAPTAIRAAPGLPQGP